MFPAVSLGAQEALFCDLRASIRMAPGIRFHPGCPAQDPAEERENADDQDEKGGFIR